MVAGLLISDGVGGLVSWLGLGRPSVGEMPMRVLRMHKAGALASAEEPEAEWMVLRMASASRWIAAGSSWSCLHRGRDREQEAEGILEGVTEDLGLVGQERYRGHWPTVRCDGRHGTARNWVEDGEMSVLEAYLTVLEGPAAPEHAAVPAADLVAQLLERTEQTAAAVAQIKGDLENAKQAASSSQPLPKATGQTLARANALVGPAPRTNAVPAAGAPEPPQPGAGHGGGRPRGWRGGHRRNGHRRAHAAGFVEPFKQGEQGQEEELATGVAISPLFRVRGGGPAQEAFRAKGTMLSGKAACCYGGRP